MKYNKNGSVRFNLKKKNDSQGEPIKTNLQIWLTFNYEGNRIRYYTGKAIDQKHWDEKNQRAKTQFTDSTILNAYLQELAKLIDSTYTKSFINDERITIQDLRDKLDEKRRKSDSEFFALFKCFIEAHRSQKAITTTKKYETTLRHLKTFEEKKKYKVSFNSIDQRFESKFRDHLLKNEKLTDNTISKHIKALKTFLNYATDIGKNKNIEFRKFSIKENKPEIIVLSWDELMTLYEYDVAEPRLKKVRDIFCFGCFTGLRFSDILQLSPENISYDYIIVKTIKTRKETRIPITKYSRVIIDKYYNQKNSTLLPSISNQKMNLYLKELAKLAELDEKVQIIKYQGNKRIENFYPKHEVISSHTARKTFITNALRLGISSEIIMDITGHSDHKVFERYYKIVDDQKKEAMLKAFE